MNVKRLVFLILLSILFTGCYSPYLGFRVSRWEVDYDFYQIEKKLDIAFQVMEADEDLCRSSFIGADDAITSIENGSSALFFRDSSSTNIYYFPANVISWDLDIPDEILDFDLKHIAAACFEPGGALPEHIESWPRPASWEDFPYLRGDFQGYFYVRSQGRVKRLEYTNAEKDEDGSELWYAAPTMRIAGLREGKLWCLLDFPFFLRMIGGGGEGVRAYRHLVYEVVFDPLTGEVSSARKFMRETVLGDQSDSWTERLF